MLNIIFILSLLSKYTVVGNFTYSSQYDYKNFTSGFTSPDGTTWTSNNNHPRFIADINGDGMDDIVRIGNANIYVAYGCGYGFSTPFSWSKDFTLNSFGVWNRNPRFMGDVNGDGRIDILGYGATGVSALLNLPNGPVLTSTVNYGYTYSSYDQNGNSFRLSGDVNGDGKVDLVVVKSDGVYVRLNDGNGFQTEKKWTNLFSFTNGGWTNQAAQTRSVVDLDGDGKDDFLGFGTYNFTYSMSNGTAFYNYIVNTDEYAKGNGWVNQNLYARFMVDVKGDNKKEIVALSHNSYVSQYDSSVSTLEVWLETDMRVYTIDAAPRLFGDFNCDGKKDLIHFNADGNGAKVYLSGTSSNYSLCKNPICNLCSPKNTSCTLCSNLPVYHYTIGCECPKGSYFNSSGKCLSSNNFTLIDTQTTSSCSHIIILATIPPEEASFYNNFNVDWSFSSNATDVSKLNALTSLVDSQSNLSITIPNEYFETNASYSFTVTRFLIQGTLTSNSTTFNFNFIKSCSSTQTIKCNSLSSECVDCSDSFTCKYNSRTHCDLPSNTCYECLDNSHCTTACNLGTHTCYDCLTNAECTNPAKPSCLVSSNKCVACLADNDCGPGMVCFENNCIQCSNDTHCKNGQVCNTVINTCVNCYRDSDCNNPTNLNYKCNTTSFSCQKCLSSLDCTSSMNLPQCFLGDCVECFQNYDCLSKPSSKVCKFSTKNCVQCISNSDCSSPASYCNTTSNKCQGCLSDDECLSSNSFCDSNHTCKECFLDTHCLPLAGANRFCSKNYFYCIQEPSGYLFGPLYITGYLEISLTTFIFTQASLYSLSWNVSSSSSSPFIKASLYNLVRSVQTKSLKIDSSFLENGVEYNFTVVYTDEHGAMMTFTHQIIPICPREVYYIPGLGCAGTCQRGCFECDNPNTCITCAPFAVLNSTERCEMFSFITISTPELLNPSTKTLLIASIDPLEQGYYSIVYEWSIITLFGSTPVNLQNLFSSQKFEGISIPPNYLAFSTDYLIQVSYINYQYQRISASLTLSIGSGLLPSLQIDGGSYQILKRGVDNIVKLFLVDGSPLNSLRSIWQLTSGPKLIIESPSVQNPLWFPIDSCKMKEESIYKFRIIYVSDFLETMDSMTLTIKTMGDNFVAKILDGNRALPYNKPLNLSSQVVFDNNCPDVLKTNFRYTWSCTNMSSKTNGFCTDIDGIFNVARPYSFILIPNYYFKINETLKFSLNISQFGKVSKADTEIKIGPANTIPLKISCISDCSSPFLNLGKTLSFKVEISTPRLLNFTWKINPPTKFVSLGNMIFLDGYSTIPPSSNFKISVIASNSTHSGESFFSLQFNKPPSSGSFVITPEVGEALTTVFELASKDWLDEDSPLGYQYSYRVVDSSDKSWRSLGEPRLYSSFLTRFPASPPRQNLTVKVHVIDSYSAFSSLEKNITVTNKASTLGEIYSNVENFLENSKSYDPEQYLSTFALALNQIQLGESIKPATICPTCSGHGECYLSNSTICKCLYGWHGTDCSVSEAVLNSIISTKIDIIKKLGLEYNNKTEAMLRSVSLSALKDLTANALFNNGTTINATQDFMDLQMKILSDNVNLTISQKNDLTKILSNIVQSFARDDCSCQTANCQGYGQTLTRYFNKIASDEMTLPNLASPSTDYSTPIYDFVIKQASICDVEKLELASLSSSQKIRLKEKNSTDHDCAEIVTVQTFAFQDKSELFSCQSFQSVVKENSKIGVSVTILSTNQDISNQYSLIITKSPNQTCPALCASSYGVNILICTCSKATDFNPRSQIRSIFTASEFETLLKYDSLANWNPGKSPVFWTDVLLVIWYMISFVQLEKTKLKNLEVENLLKEPTTMKRIILYNFLRDSQVLNIYFMQDDEMSKRMRLTVCFMDLTLIGMFNAIFSEAYIGQNFIEKIQNLQFLAILLPYWTLLPIAIISNYLIKHAFKKKDSKKSANIKKISIFLVLLFITMVAFMSTFIIAVNKDSSWEYFWLTSMAINVFFQLVISPCIQVLFSFIIFYISEQKTFKPVEAMRSVRSRTRMYPSKSKVYPISQGFSDNKFKVDETQGILNKEETINSENNLKDIKIDNQNNDNNSITKVNIDEQKDETKEFNYKLEDISSKIVDMEQFQTGREHTKFVSSINAEDIS